MNSNFRNYSNILDKYKWLIPFSILVFLPFNNISTAFLVITSLFGFYYLMSNFKITVNDRKIKMYIWLFLCFFIPMIISLPDAVNYSETSRKVLNFLIIMFMGIAIIRIFENYNKKNLLILGIGTLLTFWTIDALAQYIFGYNILGYSYSTGQLRGIFYPHFRIGIVLAILSPIYFEFIRFLQNKYSLSWVLLFLFLIVIFLSGNRNAWFMLFLSGVLYLLFIFYSGLIKELNIKAVGYGFIIVGVIIYLITYIQPSIMDNTKSLIKSRVSTISYNLDDSEKINALEHRVEIWETGLRIASIHWFNGIGVRGFRYIDKQKYIDTGTPIISEKASISTHPHQITLEILVETGAIGILGYILFWILLARLYINIVKNNKYNCCLPWFIPVIVSMFPLNMHKAFYGHFSSIIIWLSVSFLLAFYPKNAFN